MDVGLDIHGVLGEAVAEPGEKKQERAKWAPLTLMRRMLPHSFQNYLRPGGLPHGRWQDMLRPDLLLCTDAGPPSGLH